MLHRHTVGIIGTGQVGTAAASALFQQRIANELILVDLDRRRAEGEAMDLMHAQGYVGRRRVRAGDYQDLADAQIVIVTAGVGQQPGEDRLSLLNRNTAVFRRIAEELDRHAPGGDPADRVQPGGRTDLRDAGALDTAAREGDRHRDHAGHDAPAQSARGALSGGPPLGPCPDPG